MHIVDEKEEQGGTTTKAFPVTLYKVSREWIKNLFDEMKRNIMAQAINNDCPKHFLAELNGIELDFSDDARIKLITHTLSGEPRKSAPPPTPKAEAKPEPTPEVAPEAAPVEETKSAE